MLTNEQIEQVIQIADELGYGITEKQVSGTRDDLNKYGSGFSYDRLREHTVAGLQVREIEGAQARRGQPRFTIVIVDFGDVRGIAQF
jgi:hypothetical protein